jgi:hypothetical protein
MHRKKQSRARQARRRETQQMALAKEKTAKLALDIRRLNDAHRREVARLHATIRWNERNDAFYARTLTELCRTVEELTEEMKSFKRMTHAETVLRANVKPDSEPRPHHQSIPQEPSPAQD